MNKEAGISTFRLEGRLVRLVGKDEGKPKRLLVATAEGECCIKLSKYLRRPLAEVLRPGDWLEIAGEQKYKYKTGELKLKAFQVNLKARVKPEELEKLLPSAVTAPVKSSVILCQKSSCRQRGAALVNRAMRESLRDRGLEDQVAIKETGCMKQCKQGPCMVFMPDKARYTQVEPKQVPMLVEKHFAAGANKSLKAKQSATTD
ncbi:MAG TPA: NADH:ubiquinone oxidoreductase [Cyanobacteria bacterium UBA8803]|nr:NADH:ubiquinone oxidoreductase [Cyanobacteria bacterium UBA9273]HBL62984.1 NADH:ubiquinone oxidoreductase [Cyanobacteria bacterium UBA8803]